MNLLKFLNKDKNQDWEDEIPISKRLVDEKGKPIKFRISSMSGKEYDSYQEQASVLDVKNKTARYSASKYREAVIINHTIEPSFKDAEALKEGGFVKPEQYLHAVLKAGEQNKLFTAIVKLSGFDDTIDDLVVEAKNS